MNKKEAFALMSDQLAKGAFLTVSDGKAVNTMTIGWATTGIVWGKDVMTVMVRYSRHTYDIIKNASSFTVSIPSVGEMKSELALMGTKSGRDMDKYKATGLKLKDAKSVDTPVIEGAAAYYECDIIYTQAMDPSGIIPGKGVQERYYEGNNDYHVIFYGEIKECY